MPVPEFHAFLSPSGAPAWSLCWGKPNAEKGIPDKDSPASKDGTISHELFEYCVKNGFSPLTARGPETWDTTRRVRIDKLYQWVMNKCLEGYTIASEQKVSPLRFVGHNHCDGSCDLYLTKGAHLIVLDLKDGFGYVSPDMNEQAVLYAGGVICSLLNEDGTTRFSTVTLAIGMPKIRNELTTVVEEVTYPIQVIFHELERLGKISQECLKDDAPRTPGKKQCKWCKAKPNCQEYLSQSEKPLQELQVQIKESLPVSDLQDSQLEELITLEGLVMERFNDIREEALDRAVKGSTFENLKVVRSAKHKKFVLSEQETVAALKSMSLSEKEMFSQELMPISELRKVKKIKDSKIRSKKFESLLYKPEGDLKIVTLDSKGKPLSPEELNQEMSDDEALDIVSGDTTFNFL